MTWEDSKKENKEKEKEKEKEENNPQQHQNNNPVLNQIKEKANSFIRSDKIGTPQNTSEFLSRNALRLIEKTYWFIGIILVMFILVAIFRESVVDKILPLWTLILGGILGWIANGILKGDSNNH